MTLIKQLLAATALVSASATVANATDLEVMHWWTSGGEAAAVAEFANARSEERRVGKECRSRWSRYH